MSKPDAPQQPNFQAAAHENQFTPYGNITWSDSVDPNGQNQRWTSNVTLNPMAQKTLDTQMGLSQGVGEVANQFLPQVQDRYSQPMNTNSVQGVADKAYGAMTSRLDPRFQREEDQLRTRLANQGLSAGGEAYNNEMMNFNQGKNDAYQQANLGAIGTMPQTYQLESSMYNQPLNTLNALRTGAQVQNPQFQQLGGGLQAANAQNQAGMQQYGNDVNQYNAMMNGLFGLGGAGIMAVSDRRLKSNIVRIGTHPLGIGIYEYDLFGKREVGVMADEVEKVLPEAVMEFAGFKGVNYGML
jgi:hypothetical protein